MKMVSAAKYARAERELKPARVYGTGALGERSLLRCVMWGQKRKAFMVVIKCLDFFNLLVNFCQKNLYLCATVTFSIPYK